MESSFLSPLWGREKKVNTLPPRVRWGVLDVVRGRNDTRTVQNIVGPEIHQFKNEGDMCGTDFGLKSGRPSLEARNEIEIQQHPNEITQRAQTGVQKAEAAALVWSKKAAYGSYALIWLCSFMLALQSSISNSILQNAYSHFAAAPQVSTAEILSNVIRGVPKLPIARILNLWGRTEGFIVFVGVYIVGLIILAACDGPNAHAAGYVLYWVGYDAIYLILDVYVADTFGLRNRAFTFGFVSTPFICTAFAGPLAAQTLLKTASWCWGYGIFTIASPFVFIPLAAIFKLYQRKAETVGIYKRRPSGRTLLESIIHYIHEFDLVGAVLLMAAFLFLFLPFSLQLTAQGSPFGCKRSWSLQAQAGQDI